MEHVDEDEPISEPTPEQIAAHELYKRALRDYRREKREAETPEKRILAVGKIHPPMYLHPIKELHWVDEDGISWLSYEELPCRTAQQAWSCLDGLVLE